jgi:hypothetical protein
MKLLYQPWGGGPSSFILQRCMWLFLRGSAARTRR